MNTLPANSPTPAQLALLVVDDSPAECEAVRRRFEGESNFRVVVTCSREEFERQLASEPFDLVVSELAPWGLDDQWTFDRLDKQAQGVPLVIITARGSECAAVAAMKRGAVDYLTKSPGYLDALPQRLAESLRIHDEQRRESRRREQWLNQALNLVSVVGFDGYIKHWNPAWEAALGYTQEEMLAVPLRERLHRDDRARAAEFREQFIKGKPVMAAELRVVCKDGSYIWMLLNALPCLEQQVYLATAQDITNRKRVEEQLRESQERFLTIAGATKDAVWDWDLRENKVWRNESYFQLFGMPDADPANTIEWWLSRIHPDDRPRVMEALPPPVVNGQQQWILEYRLLRADGTYGHVFDRGFVVFNSEGQSVRMVGSLMDISALKNAEERLRESEERFRLATKATRDAIWDWDLQKGDIWRSEGFQTLFGYRPDEVEPNFDWWRARIHPDDRDRVLSELPLLDRSTSQQCMFEYRFRRADGSYADVIDRGFVMYDADGKPARMIGSIMDISERRRAEEMAHVHRDELAHIARVSTMGEIATGLAHELNQPLTAIANYAETCARSLRAQNGDPKVLDWIEKIAANTHRAGEIIRRLRGFTRKSESRRSTVEVGELMEEVIALLEADARLQSVRVRWEEPYDKEFVTVDPIQIQQVLVNLLRNAFEAMAGNRPECRQVTIAATADDEFIEISVEDQGEGIAPENFDRVFEAFFTNKSNGVGIGLAISRSIVEDHGGRLWVTPNPTQGVTFRFTLPLVGVPDVHVTESSRRR
jgi:PAS domain S-box-containing protein